MGVEGESSSGRVVPRVEDKNRLSMLLKQILNMLASLEALMALGKCREMPVMG